ncbi:MAG: metallophosphoesterase [Clostridia bacterium]|nr:metallophosphoesterase [Clostridia bacterium]
MVYITGDMHGDQRRFNTKDIKQLSDGDTLIICGDFGFVWEDNNKEKEFLKWLGTRKYNVCFLDGPHDNFDRIYACRKTVWKGGLVHRISGSLFHMCRGQIFNIDGYKIFTFGGGESSDRDMRNDSKRWFKEELPSPDQMREGAENLDEAGLKVDYIITHEPPSVMKRAMQLRAGKNAYVNKLNGYLEEINRGVDFKRWYFGSVHEDRPLTKKHVAVFEKVLPIDYEIIPDTLLNI